MIVFNFSSLSSKVTGSVILIGSKYAPVTKMTQSARSITSKIHRPRDASAKPAPFPYKEKKYGFFQSLFDDTRARFDDNTKLVVVEGPPAIGKDKFAKELADDLGMLYMPNPKMELAYVNSYGVDMRDLNKDLPEEVQFVDENDFVKNPKDRNIPRLQYLKFMERYIQQWDAITHILNTGQGVVLTRCAHSDYVFTEAMFQQGFISKSFYNYYQEVRKNVIPFVLRPELVIYLDVPAAEIKRRIQQRNNPVEVNSPVYQEGFLQSLEHAYKQNYLKDISAHAELLVYDWSEGGDVEVVVEDVERVDFDRFGPYEEKMKDWRLNQNWQLNYTRYEFTNFKDRYLGYFNVPAYNCPEIMSSGESVCKLEQVIESTPGLKYVAGFNAEKGDEGLLFKLK